MRPLFPNVESVRNGFFNVYVNEDNRVYHGGRNRTATKAAEARSSARRFGRVKPLYAINVRMKKEPR